MKQFYPKQCDILVWDMAGVAHKLLRMPEEVNHLYPELVPFLEILATTYPALQETTYVKKEYANEKERSYQV